MATPRRGFGSVAVNRIRESCSALAAGCFSGDLALNARGVPSELGHLLRHAELLGDLVDGGAHAGLFKKGRPRKQQSPTKRRGLLLLVGSAGTERHVVQVLDLCEVVFEDDVAQFVGYVASGDVGGSLIGLKTMTWRSLISKVHAENE